MRWVTTSQSSTGHHLSGKLVSTHFLVFRAWPRVLSWCEVTKNVLSTCWFSMWSFLVCDFKCLLRLPSSLPLWWDCFVVMSGLTFFKAVSVLSAESSDGLFRFCGFFAGSARLVCFLVLRAVEMVSAPRHRIQYLCPLCNLDRWIAVCAQRTPPALSFPSPSLASRSPPAWSQPNVCSRCW